MATDQLSYTSKPVALVHTVGAPWGTAVFPSSKTANITTHEAGTGEREKLSNAMQAGGGGMGTVFQASNYVQQPFTKEMDVTYNSAAFLQVMTAFFGQYNSTTNTGVQTHVSVMRKKLTPAQIEDCLFSFWKKEGEELKYIPSIYINEITLTYDGQLKIKVSGIGDKLYLGSPTQITNMEALGFPADVPGPYPIFDHCVVRMNNGQDVVGDANVALSGSDEINPTSLELTFKRPVKVNPIPSGSDAIAMPTDTANEPVEILLKMGFTFKDADSAAYFSKHQAATSYKADITFMSPGSIPTKAVPYVLNFQLPRLQVDVPSYNVDDTSVDGTFMVAEAVGNPAGMSSVLPRFSIVNTIAAQTFPA